MPWTQFRRRWRVPGRAPRDQGYALDPIPPEGVGAGAGQGYALDPTPPEVAGAGAGSPRSEFQGRGAPCAKIRESLPVRWQQQR